MATYAVTSLICAVVYSPIPGSWPAFLTYWTYFTLTIYFLMVAEQCCCRRTDEDGPEDLKKLPWYLIMVWTLFEIMSPMAIAVTLLYWITVFPLLNCPIGNNGVLLHIMNSVVVLIDHSVTALPIRLLHVVYSLIFGLVYVIFTVICWA
ncbi:uncharacterized protein LOC126824218, partial [Patella vulgata]|uniref:uncharacterized protein LOC126824218 n=1 Tax=Patella vulgata TaxID=6465 RepID=UPI00217FC185